jgi:hypothetical protein
MNTQVSLEELVAAHEWVTAGEATALLDCEAYVSRATGKVHWCGEGVDEEPPEGIEDDTLYVAVPHKRDFDLGRSLALRFAAERVPHENEAVYECFRGRGAYSRFKALLARTGQLDAWYEYEQAAIESAFREWCEENGFVLTGSPRAQR